MLAPEMAQPTCRSQSIISQAWLSHPHLGYKFLGMIKLERNRLIELAGERVFRRGEEYFAWQRVRGIAADGGRISAIVDGTQSYRVSLWVNNGAFAYECNCPEGTVGRFCKHCVAVGLSWLAVEGSFLSGAKRLDLHSYLAHLPAEKLVDLILDQTARDAQFHARLRLLVARSCGIEPELDEQRRLLEFAAHAAGSTEDVTAFSAILQEVEKTLTQLLEVGFAEQAAALIEGSMAFLPSYPTEAGDRLLKILLTQHRKSCQQTDIAADLLARRLLEWQLSCPAAARDEVTDNYSDLLGRRGWEAYHQLAQTEWEHLSANGNLLAPEQRERCVRLTALIEHLAKKSGDAATLIAIKSHSLEDASSYLEIARLYKQMRDEKLALDWAQRGKERFPAIDADGLYEFLAEEYQTRGAWQEALAIIFAQFCARPSLRSYQRIIHAARKAGELDNWRGRALSILRQPTGGTSPTNDFGDLDQSTLVSILLWENDVEAAWQAAQQGSCNADLLQELAKRRAKEYPNDALLIYKHLVALYVGRKNRYSYELAVETLRRIGRLLRRQRRQAEFVPYIESLCRSHRYQHSLVKMLRQLIARYSRGEVGKNYQ